MSEFPPKQELRCLPSLLNHLPHLYSTMAQQVQLHEDLCLSPVESSHDQPAQAGSHPPETAFTHGHTMCFGQPQGHGDTGWRPQRPRSLLQQFGFLCSWRQRYPGTSGVSARDMLQDTHGSMEPSCGS